MQSLFFCAHTPGKPIKLLRLVGAEHGDLLVKHVDDGLQLRVTTFDDKCNVVLLVTVLHHLRTGVVFGLLPVGIEPVKEQATALGLLVIG